MFSSTNSHIISNGTCSSISISRVRTVCGYEALQSFTIVSLKNPKIFWRKKIRLHRMEKLAKNPSIPGPAVKCGKLKNMFEVSTADIIIQCVPLVSEG